MLRSARTANQPGKLIIVRVVPRLPQDIAGINCLITTCVITDVQIILRPGCPIQSSSRPGQIPRVVQIAAPTYNQIAVGA